MIFETLSHNLRQNANILKITQSLWDTKSLFESVYIGRDDPPYCDASFCCINNLEEEKLAPDMLIKAEKLSKKPFLVLESIRMSANDEPLWFLKLCVFVYVRVRCWSPRWWWPQVKTRSCCRYSLRGWRTWWGKTQQAFSATADRYRLSGLNLTRVCCWRQIPNLSRGHIEECGHWTQMERPAETNRILISWLKETHKKPAGVGVAPKLWGQEGMWNCLSKINVDLAKLCCRVKSEQQMCWADIEIWQ